MSILAKAELVGANTVKGAVRPVSVPKAALRAASNVENRLSVARSSPVVGREAAPGGRVGVSLGGIPGPLVGPEALSLRIKANVMFCSVKHFK